jgi:hypothetical protein
MLNPHQATFWNPSGVRSLMLQRGGIVRIGLLRAGASPDTAFLGKAGIHWSFADEESVLATRRACACSVKDACLGMTSVTLLAVCLGKKDKQAESSGERQDRDQSGFSLG